MQHLVYSYIIPKCLQLFTTFIHHLCWIYTSNHSCIIGFNITSIINIWTCIIIVVILLSSLGFNNCITYQNQIPVLFNHHLLHSSFTFDTISNINHIFPLYIIIMNQTSKLSNYVSTKTKWSHKSCINAKHSGHTKQTFSCW